MAKKGKNVETTVDSLHDLRSLFGLEPAQEKAAPRQERQIPGKALPSGIPNIGWLFYKDYYNDWDGKGTGSIKEKNELIFAQKLARQQPDYFMPDPKLQTGILTIRMKTGYPGFLTGSGVPHGVSDEEAVKLGFYFDHSTGLPALPGSSVKGVLRSAFPGGLIKTAAKYSKKEPAYADFLREQANRVEKYLCLVLLPAAGIDAKTIESLDVNALELHIFEGIDAESGKPASVYQRDVFHDAFPFKSHFMGIQGQDADQGRILGQDSITHHHDALKDPNPIRFLKVLPEVEFMFQFRLHAYKQNGKELVSTAQKRDLFEAILQDRGAGAKTRVNYGQFEKAL